MTTDEPDDGPGPRPAAGGGSRTPTRRAAPRTRLSTKDLPAWLSAGVAVITLVLTIGAGIIGLLSNRDEPSASASSLPSPAAASLDPADPVVLLAGFVPDPDLIIADGEFRNLVLGRDKVVLMGESKVDPTAERIFKEAELEPDDPAASGPVEGRWVASVPRPEGAWRWYAGVVIVPLGAGGNAVWADLAASGADSAYWQTLSAGVDGP